MRGKGNFCRRLGQLSLRWQVMACLTAFVAVLMLLLWLFQVVLLDNFYEAIKTQTIKKTAQAIARNIDQQDISDKLDRLTRQPDIYVRIFDRQGETVYKSLSGPMSMVHDMDREEALGFFQTAEENGGAVLELFRQDFPNPFADSAPKEDFRGDRGRWKKEGKHTTLVVCAQLVESKEQGTLLILLSSALTPLNTTSETLKVQFLCIAAILLLLSAVIAFFLSRRIASPLVSLSRSARVLATGQYDVTFEGGGYREVQ